MYTKSSHQSFQEELELYELLDLEENGVGDVDVSVDDATAEVLLNGSRAASGKVSYR